MRGYFGIGVEGISKPANVGAVMRTAHAFGASFVFTIAPVADVQAFRAADTSEAAKNVLFYAFPDVAAVSLPKDCDLIGSELMGESIGLTRFRHPRRGSGRA